MHGSSATTALLGDSGARDYTRQLNLFNAFAEPELRQAVASLNLKPGMRVLDAGCGTGQTLNWLATEVGSEGVVVGIDLAAAHTTVARSGAVREALIIQADFLKAPLASASFDLVWSVNTINHMRHSISAVKNLATLLRPGGRIALGQSALLPDMYFSWDSRLERLTTDAMRQYYRARYGLEERDTTDSRAVLGVLRRAGLRNISVHTFIIERISPLTPTDQSYLLEIIFRATWCERLRPYLSPDDHEEYTRLCNPQHPDSALRRSDFHFLQTFTTAVGSI